MPTARVLQSEKRPISGSGSSAFSQFKSGGIIPRTEGLSSIIRSRDQRSLVNHLTEQQKHRTTLPEQHRYSADRQRLAEQQSRTLAEQQRSLAEAQQRTLLEQRAAGLTEAQQRTLLEQRAAGLTEAQQRTLLEQRGAGLTEAQLRGLTVSGLTDMQALQHVARSITESQQQAVARSIAESQQQVDAARQQRLLHQELAAALAQHTQSPNQLQQVILTLQFFFPSFTCPAVSFLSLPYCDRVLLSVSWYHKRGNTEILFWNFSDHAATTTAATAATTTAATTDESSY